MSDKTYPEPVVGTFILNDKKEILLINSPKWGGLYTVPGGHVELGETIEQAVKREVKEETGIDVDFVKVFDIQDNIFDETFHQKKHFIFLNCLCQAKTVEVKLDHREAVDSAWFKLAEIPQMANVSQTIIKPVKEILSK